jgi:hypothetical protein
MLRLANNARAKALGGLRHNILLSRNQYKQWNIPLLPGFVNARKPRFAAAAAGWFGA